jgi:hypothetical protein
MNEPMMFLFAALLVGCSSGIAASAGRGLADPAVAAARPASGGTAQANPVGRATGTPGVWENVTPPGMSLDAQSPGKGDNYGVQDVLADPARPGDLYAFVCYQGVWRSTDFGTTWKQVNLGSDWSKPWGTAIDPNPKRDPNTPPVLYAGASNPIGFLKSVDFGVTWTVQRMPESFGDFRYQQVYSVDVDPNDKNHVLIAFHEAPDIGESTDGGKTWKKVPTPPEDGGSSYYPFFVNTGSAKTTRTTWLVIPQQNSEARALRTTDGGAHFTKLGKFQHHHGSAQLFDAGAGTLYLSAMQPSGIHKSTDYGQTWTTLSDVSDGIIAGSRGYLYGAVGLGWGSVSAPLDPHMARASRSDDGRWSAVKAPAGMVDGAKRIAVTRDAAHDILVAGSWHAGIWRYIEP